MRTLEEQQKLVNTIMQEKFPECFEVKLEDVHGMPVVFILYEGEIIDAIDHETNVTIEVRPNYETMRFANPNKGPVTLRGNVERCIVINQTNKYHTKNTYYTKP